MATKENTASLAVPRRQRLRAAKVVALLLCAVAVGVMINAASFPSTAIETDIGAGAFPIFYAGLLIVLALLLVVREYTPGQQRNSSQEQESADNIHPGYGRTATGIILTAVYIVLMGYLGYLIATPLFLASIMVLMGYIHRLLTPLMAILLTIVLWLLFVQVLQVPLPVGSLFE
ncbi:tripartite tricarboxylate transporter TctB family protein [Buttiauxella warmboldiae]|uniref:Tripartite tricarboxylate transporter TctB family protein n=1 Tax=Buttiauxella warmboldiae TaxID=82993 RepID=A0A3N5DWK7_9ENTR|nr:tripartite tricarboxylate transporter TctB family protein [Buttiauxella warmboldiae]RPH26489.1 tripartite tricarboxylate transporter TctB family protein [Buttiauxella warmboldiae]